MGIAACNRRCRLAGLVILFIATAWVHLRTPSFGDFVQFQMAGLVDRAGAWDALYPVPVPGSIHNAGNLLDSIAKPRADQIAALHGIDFVPYHFILPPPTALLFWPLGFFDGRTSLRLWLLVSVFAGWATAVQAGMILQRCAGRPTRWAGFVTLIIAAMPAMRRAVLDANLSPMISATIGWAVLSLMSTEEQGEQAFGTAAALVLGTVMKYASAVLLPIALVQRRWRTIGWGIVITIAWSGITIALMGRAPLIEFATVIAPTLGRSYEMADNIGLTGVLLHALHQLPPLAQNLRILVSIVQSFVLGAILLAIIRLGRDRMREPEAICCAAMALMAWLLFFSPVAWSHYLIYLCPMWGWLACPTEKGRVRRTIGWLAMGLIIFSPDQMPPPALDAWGLHLMASILLMLTLGIAGLYRLLRQNQIVPVDHFIVRGLGKQGPHLGSLFPGDPQHILE